MAASRVDDVFDAAFAIDEEEEKKDAKAIEDKKIEGTSTNC